MTEEDKAGIREGLHDALDVMIDEVFRSLHKHDVCLWTERLDQYERKSFVSIAFGQPADAIVEFMKQGAAGSLDRVDRNNQGDPQ